MNLDCLNDIITSNLAIHIDLTDPKSWDMNTGLTSISLTKWSDAVSDNIDLLDFGLTGFDNGRTNKMWDKSSLTPQDTLYTMYRVGFNNVYNPISGETSGVTSITEFLPISAITTNINGNYFELNGGYLQGEFRLNGYNYELFPSRYNDGITIETLLYLVPESQGIFYMMGARAEDKYNPYFSGETTNSDIPTGVETSLGNVVNAFMPAEVLNDSFSQPENNMFHTEYNEIEPINNIKNNVISFELTEDKKISYKYINDDGLIISNKSKRTVDTTGFTMITVVFTPNDIYLNAADLECKKQRLGKMIFYVNGRPIWIIRGFPEYYFKGFVNDKEKQIGVPFSISWGGGSFGLQESWHYDYQTYIIYEAQNEDYINSKFFVEHSPIETDDYIPPVSGTSLDGLSLTVDNQSFIEIDPDYPNIEYPSSVMSIEYTGGTGNTGSTYYIRFAQPISVISNRDYLAELSIYVDNFFNPDAVNKVKILVNGDDVNVVNDVEYVYPLTTTYLIEAGFVGEHLFPDEYQWSVDGVLYYGQTGFPVTRENSQLVGYTSPEKQITDYAVTGEMSWLPVKTTFRAPDNSGQNFVNIGILIESTMPLNPDGVIFIDDFNYTAADILVQDEKKDNLIIEQNFNNSFIGGIQKLRLYDRAFTSPEVLHNSVFESKNNSDMKINKGGRLIYR